MSMYDFEATYGSTRSLSLISPTPPPPTTTTTSNTTTTQNQKLLTHHKEKYSTTSQAITASDGIQKVLEEISTDVSRRVDEGFNIRNFTFGVINTFVIVYVFGAYPQYFWILYLVESCILIPIKFCDLKNQKPLNGIYYLLDYCWCMNFLGVGLLLLFVFTFRGNDMAHKIAFQTAFGVACGPLMGACLLLPFCALVFHNWCTMCDLFIHIFPPMLLYTTKWKYVQLQETWPNIFQLDMTSLNEEIPFFGSIKSYNGDGGTIAANTMILYFIWLIPYLIWMITCGMSLPSKSSSNNNTKRYDTVFHATMRGGLCITLGTNFWDRSIEESKQQMLENNFDFEDFLIYMTFHFLLVLSSVLFLAYPCYKSQYFHATILWIMAIVCATRGAMRYTYYSTDMYVKLIQKVLNETATEEDNIRMKKNLLKEEGIGGGGSIGDNKSTPLLV